MNVARSLCVLGGIVAFLACGRQPSQDALSAPSSSRTESTSAMVTRETGDPGAPRDVAALDRARVDNTLSAEDTAHLISKTFCDHEVACDNVGPTRAFANRFDCEDRQLISRRAAIRASVCQGRLPKSDVSRCLDVLRGAACTRTDEGVSAIAVCRAGALCGP